MAVFQYYKDRGNRWRWRLRNDEGKIIAVSGEGFVSKDECLEDLDTARQLSAISEVRIYESEEEFSVYKEAPDTKPSEEAVPEETLPIEPEEELASEPEMPAEEPVEEEESELEKEPEPSEPEESIEEEEKEEGTEPVPGMLEQPDDIPPLIEKSSYTSIQDKWKKPNWALITSAVAVVIIAIMIVFLFLKEKPEPEPMMLEILPESGEQAPETEPPGEPVVMETPAMEPEPIMEEVIEPAEPEQETDITELKTTVESPELSNIPEPEPVDIFHKVVKGDKLWSLADDYYSDAYLWPTIYNANTGEVKDPDLLRIGIELLIPALEGEKAKLSDSDLKKVAKGYVRAYLIYKQLGKKDAILYLVGAYFYDELVLTEFRDDLDPNDVQRVKKYKRNRG